MGCGGSKAIAPIEANSGAGTTNELVTLDNDQASGALHEASPPKKLGATLQLWGHGRSASMQCTQAQLLFSVPGGGPPTYTLLNGNNNYFLARSATKIYTPHHVERALECTPSLLGV